MPTVRNIPGPYRFFFYSFDCHEPPHVHVRRERMLWQILADTSFNEHKSRVFVPRLNVSEL